MKRFGVCFGAGLIFCTLVSRLVMPAAAQETVPAESGSGASVQLTADCSITGKKIGNKASNINLWTHPVILWEGEEEGADLRPFVEYVQFMQATGSSFIRDPFLNPQDYNVLDDYNFEPLIQSSAKVLELGAKPHIKFSVPTKYSPNGTNGPFHTNIYPPDDYEVYGRFVRALTCALIERFGVEEVRTWRFGVLTEFENDSWFKARSGSPEDTQEAYFKLYDYTADALMSELGPDIFIGAHAMACIKGFWDERNLLDHCANGTNYANGQKGTPIRFMACSFYDYSPGNPAPRGLVETIDELRARAEEVGLTDLIYGVDEGRLLGSHAGIKDTALGHRMVGRTYQGASDARYYKLMTDHDIDYLSVWTYSSRSPYTGYPTVSYHVARNFAEFKNALSVPVEKTASQLPPGVQVDAVVGAEPEKETVRVMVYNFKDDWNYDQSADASITLSVPFFAGKTVKITKTVIDDSVNYFVQWEKDRQRLGLGDQFGPWSPDDPGLDTDSTLTDPKVKEIYQRDLRAEYVKIANSVTPVTETRTVSEEGVLTLNETLSRQAVVFYTIEAEK